MRGRTSKLVAYLATLIVLSTVGAYLLRAGQQGKAPSFAPERQDWAAYGGGPLNGNPRECLSLRVPHCSARDRDDNVAAFQLGRD